MSEPSELEYAWSVAEARNERICQVLEDNLALRARVAKLEAATQGMLDEWDKFTRYGSPMAKAANERVAFARAALKDKSQ